MMLRGRAVIFNKTRACVFRLRARTKLFTLLCTWLECFRAYFTLCTSIWWYCRTYTTVIKFSDENEIFIYFESDLSILDKEGLLRNMLQPPESDKTAIYPERICMPKKLSFMKRFTTKISTTKSKWDKETIMKLEGTGIGLYRLRTKYFENLGLHLSIFFGGNTRFWKICPLKHWQKLRKARDCQN